MSRASSLVLLIVLLTSHAWAADRPGTEALTLLEGELLERPAFEAPFYELLAEALSPGGWEDLDKRWEKDQGRNRRFLVLRGMLAERQGRFDNARKHYAAAKADEWGAYHHARLVAFLGETEAAVRELRQIVDRTEERWLFREAALGLGELAHLRQGPAEAEKVYALLWDSHTCLEHRTVLLEPLLCLRTAAGTAAAWLDELRPKTAAPRPNVSEAEMDQGVLWSLGTMLSSPEERSLPTMLTEHYADEPTARTRPLLTAPPEWLNNALSHPDAARWHGLLQVEAGWCLRPEQPGMLARWVARRGAASDVEIMHLLKSAANDPQRYIEVAKAFKAVLKTRPGLLASTLLSGQMQLQGMEQWLAEEVFEGVSSPVWTLLRLHMKSAEGATPEVLADEAARLWEECRPGRLYLAGQAFPAEPPILIRLLLPTNFSPGRVAMPTGVTEPTTQVIWNLRGKAFTDAMGAQFALELQERHHAAPRQTPLVYRQDGTIGSITPTGRNIQKTLAWSEQVRAALWHMRKKLGLKAPAEPPGSLGERPEDRLADILIRGDAQETWEWLQQQQQLDEIQPRWLLTALVSVGKSSTSTTPPRGQSQAKRLAVETLRKALQSQQPGWLIPVIDAAECPSTTPTADAGEQQALLATRGMSCSRMARRLPKMLEAWEKTFGRRWTVESLEEEAAAAFTAWETDSLPHPLWGLAWRPSLRRQQTIVRRALQSAEGGGADRYLTEVLPRELERGETGRMARRAFSGMFATRDRVLSWIVKCHGTAVLRPSSARAAELASWAPKHPMVNDLLALWQVVPAQQMQDSPRPVMMQQPLSPGQHAAMVKILEESDALDAQLTFAMMQREMGDPAITHKIVAKHQGKLGPLRMLALELDRQPQEAEHLPPAMIVRPAEQETTEQEQREVIEKARKVFATAHPLKPLRSTIYAIAPSTREMRLLYDWLKKEVKAEPAWSYPIKVLAELARRLDVPEDEVTAAEQLDLKANPQDPAAWLQRGVSYSKQGKDDWAVDLFIEAVRRIDFANPPDFLSGLRPMRRGWLELAAEGGRMDELASAFGEALERTPAESAGRTAAVVMTAIVNSQETPVRKARLARLGKTVIEHQRCLVLRCFDTLRDRMAELERTDETETARLLARMILQGIWKQESSTSSQIPVSDEDVVHGEAYSVFSLWGTAPTQVHPNAPVDTILRLALQGEDAADFTASLLRDAGRFPKQEHIVSCALVAQARQGALTAEHLQLAGQLGPQARMRVAWRLCEHAPQKHLVLTELAPMIHAGLGDLLQGPTPSNNTYALFKQVIPLTAWLKHADSDEAITTLLPAMMAKATMAAKADGSLPTPTWEFLLKTSATHGTAAQTLSVAGQWRAHCLNHISQVVDVQEWGIYTTASLLRSIEATGACSADVLAAAAFDVWKAILIKLGAEQDPSVTMAGNVGMALLAAQHEEAFDALLGNMADIEFLDSHNAYREAIRHLQACSTFLNSPLSVPQIRFSVDRVDDDNERAAELRWELAIPSFAAHPPDGGGGERSPLPAWFVRNGGYEIEVYARQPAGPFKLINKFQAAERAGVVRIADLPAAGWLRVDARNTAHGTTRFETPVIYCLRAPLLASDAGQQQPGAPLQWTPEQIKMHGSPVSSSPPLERGTTLLVTLEEHGKDGANDGSSVAPWLVAMDEQGQPLGQVRLFKQELPSAPGSQNVLLDLDEAAAHMHLGAPHVPGGNERTRRRISRLAMTRPPQADTLPLARMQAQLFDHATLPSPTIPKPALLEGQEVARPGFQAHVWHLSESLPRAAFADHFTMVVYDTTRIPWKELLRRRAPERGQHKAIFVPNLKQACVLPFIPAYLTDAQQPYRIEVLRYDGGADADPRGETSTIEIPFTPIHLEMSPDERSMLFISRPFQGHLKIAWLDAELRLSVADFVPVPARWKTNPTVAWWRDNESAIISFNGDVYQAAHSKERLQFQRLQNSAEEAAQSPVTGQRLTSLKWVLKDSNILVEVDPQSGRPKQAYELPGGYVGKPMWWGKRSQRILVPTTKFNLIMVQPPEAGRSR